MIRLPQAAASNRIRGRNDVLKGTMSSIEKAILSGFRAGIVAIRMDGTVAYINPIGEKILKACALRSGENIHHRAGENSFFRVLSEALEMSYLPSRVEAELPGPDGERQSLGFTLAELEEGGEKAGICAFFKDLTHVEMAEESENLKQRLLMLGQMAAGLAHEIRNPIASIGVHCSILRSNLGRDGKLGASLDMMAREIERIEYIIRECLNFVRPAELGIQTVRVDEVVAGIIKRLETVHPGMEFEVQKSPVADLVAESDGTLLEQAITNIISNAVDACAGKGRVEVWFGITRHFRELVRLDRYLDRYSEAFLPGDSGKEEDFIRVNIRDDGPGIPREIQDKIFIPFFTTKKMGTGIGLSMAQKIVHAHGGILDLKSAPGKGTEFIIKIPVRQRVGR
jgi:signal transduction histidine kinase